jgi:hypothetical protein
MTHIDRRVPGRLGPKTPERPTAVDLRPSTLASRPEAEPKRVGSWRCETLAGFVADGFDTLVFWPVEPEADQVSLLAAEVLPQLSELA